MTRSVRVKNDLPSVAKPSAQCQCHNDECYYTECPGTDWTTTATKIYDNSYETFYLISLQSQAEQSRAEQSRAEQSRAEQSRAEQSRAEQSRAEPSQLVMHISSKSPSPSNLFDHLL
jgi:hypothetical protein